MFSSNRDFFSRTKPQGQAAQDQFRDFMGRANQGQNALDQQQMMTGRAGRSPRPMMSPQGIGAQNDFQTRAGQMNRQFQNAQAPMNQMMGRVGRQPGFNPGYLTGMNQMFGSSFGDDLVEGDPFDDFRKAMMFTNSRMNRQTDQTGYLNQLDQMMRRV